MPATSPAQPLRVAVIGAGPSGLTAGRELLRAGFERFTIFDKADAAGGTWHQHSYPGLACDVKAAAYTFSDGPNPEWSATFVEQKEIEAYLQRMADEFGLAPHMTLDTEITSCRYQPDGTWHLDTAGGDLHEFDVVINAMGNQHTPLFPEVPGIDTFAGPSWHSTEWNHEVPLEGKRVVLVGSAAAAVQIVPEIAKVAGHLTVLQRTPNWILPRGSKPYSDLSRSLLELAPLRKLHRWFHHKIMHLSTGAFIVGDKIQARVEKMGLDHIEKSVADPTLREQVTPKSRFGCKRPLMSDFYYPALQRDDVRLVPHAAREVVPEGVVTTEGETLEADVVIYCTGYKVMDFERIDVIGTGGASLAKRMEEAPEAYVGSAVPGFPNYFFALGPNALIASTSFFDAAEINLKAIVRLLGEKQKAGARAIDVTPEAHERYNAWVVEARSVFSWGVDSCNSYYRTPSGHTPFLFPGDIDTFCRQRDEMTLADFQVV
ncbi:MAG: NAD(P)/FAD-dependent oxidoreductase [bacterium]|nr:NAD(P)/FAD-dependent oxidoreductase [bacterium]